MAQQTLTRVCATYDEAVQYVYELERSGLPEGAVSLIGSETDQRLPNAVRADEGTAPAGVGATLGSAIGGGAGLLAGIGALAIPGVGPLVAAGWLVATLAGAGVGAVTGGLLGGLAQAGVSRDVAHSVATAVDSGQYVVLVRVDDIHVPAVSAILNRPLSAEVRRMALEPIVPEPGDPLTSAAGVTVGTPRGS